MENTQEDIQDQGLPLVHYVRDILLNDMGDIPYGNAAAEDRYVIFYFYCVQNLNMIVNSAPGDPLAIKIKEAINNEHLDSTIKLGYTQATN
jgi:hypothetical protein